MHHFTETYDPTLEDSYRRQCVIDGIPSHMEILDTAGQEEYGALREQWIRQNDLFVIVYDVTRRSSFEATERLFREVLDTKRKLDDRFPPSLIVLVANKSDLDARRTVGTLEGANLAKRLGCAFIETSAKLGTNVEEAFFTVIRADRLYRKQLLLSSEKERDSSDVVTLGPRPHKAGRIKFFRRFNNLLHRD